MSVIEVTSREFREKLKTYFELADKGERVIVNRGRNKSYLITPVVTGDMIVSPELEKKIAKAMEQVQKGDVVEINTEDDLMSYLDKL